MVEKAEETTINKEPTILELSRKYSTKLFISRMITLECAFCGTETDQGERSLINSSRFSWGILMRCEDHVEDAQREAMINVAVCGALPPDIVKGLNVNHNGKKYTLRYLRVSRSLYPNEFVFNVVSNNDM